MAVCNVCGKEIVNSFNKVCDDCQKMLDNLSNTDVCETAVSSEYGYLENGEYCAMYNDDNYSNFNSDSSIIDEIDSELELDSELDGLVISDDVDRIIADMDTDENETSTTFNDFKNYSIKYKKFRYDIANDKRHKEDYDKLIEFYKDDIESGVYKIGLASEIDDDTVVVDVSRGVVVYE